MGPKRYKAAYGGRGSGKSHFFAEMLIERCVEAHTRAACIREVQATIKDSVRQLLIDKIQRLGVGHMFEVLQGEIRGPHDSLIVFKGMQSYNAENIKSLEDFDVAWVEEAQTLSDHSLRLLRPTIRKPGSEIWFSWNPRYETDAVDQFFRGQAPPSNAIIVPVNWYDNPWFPDVLVEEKDQDYAADHDMAEHVWGGGYEKLTAGAYYARQIAQAEHAGRVGFFPHMRELEVYTAWDLGLDDYTAVWFLQVRDMLGKPRVRIIDYFESSDIGVDDIVATAMPEYTADQQTRIATMVEIGREQPFRYQRHFLPHDIGQREWGNGGRSRIQSMNAEGVPLHTIHRGVAQNPEERIQAVRKLLPMCEFNQTKNVMLGLTRLRRYSRKFNEHLGVYMGPLKDGNDHGADALGEFAVNCGLTLPVDTDRPPRLPPPGKMIAPPPLDERSGRRTRL